MKILQENWWESPVRNITPSLISTFNMLWHLLEKASLWRFIKLVIFLKVRCYQESCVHIQVLVPETSLSYLTNVDCRRLFQHLPWCSRRLILHVWGWWWLLRRSRLPWSYRWLYRYIELSLCQLQSFKLHLYPTGPEECGAINATYVISTSYTVDEANLTPAYMQRQCNEYAKVRLVSSLIFGVVRFMNRDSWDSWASPFCIHPGIMVWRDTITYVSRYQEPMEASVHPSLERVLTWQL